MAWNSRGLRGSFLEEEINKTNEQYQKQGLALVQKIPTPITPIRLDNKHHITLAYFDKKSTVDYIGVVQGIPVCFDAKECTQRTFPLSNVHEHQVSFMKEFEKQEGVAFFLLYYSGEDVYYYLPLRVFLVFWERAENGGRKSFRMDELDDKWIIRAGGSTIIPYLETLQKDVDDRQAGHPEDG